MKKNSKGYSLIEVLIAIFMFSFVSLGITRLYLYTFSSESRNREYYYAVKLAEEKILFLKNIRSRLLAEKPGLIRETIRFEVSKGERVEYERTSLVEISPDEMVRIQVSVSWKPAKRGTTSEYRLETFI
ncbi:MAG: prepilin-type N-terminal cleavage/methylation domain-containing protein [bacterium]|nr:prepilin-type N-terminal cleavage/methylation domain-containing protein [bacterium]